MKLKIELQKDLREEDSLEERKSPIWHHHQVCLMEEPTHLVLHPHLLQRLLYLLSTKKVTFQVRSTACENSAK